MHQIMVNVVVGRIWEMLAKEDVFLGVVDGPGGRGQELDAVRAAVQRFDAERPAGGASFA
jgi:hypothetical protein